MHGDILLGDLGLSRRLDAGKEEEATQAVATQVGTQPYMSPELVTGQDYGRSSDVWAVGALIYFLMTGKQPVSLSPTEATTSSIRTAVAAMDISGDKETRPRGGEGGGEQPPPRGEQTQPTTLDDQLSTKLLKLVHLALQPQPSQRPSISQLRGQLEVIDSLTATAERSW